MKGTHLLSKQLYIVYIKEYFDSIQLSALVCYA